MGLTIKQEKFFGLFVELGNASEAYRQAYNASKMTEKQIWEEASKLLKSPKVAQRLKEFREKQEEKLQLTVSDLIKELEETKKVALSAMIPQCGAAISATMGKAKLLGFLDKKDEGKDKEDLATALNKLIDKMPN